MRRFGFSALTVLLGLALAVPAVAGEPDVAEQLFRDGHALLKERRYQEACAKFADSQRHDPASGTLLALAYCQELSNALASARASYLAAAELARAEQQDERQRAATERAESLSTRVSTLTVNVPEALSELPTLVVKSNGVELGRSLWGRPIPSDGGSIDLVVSASDRSPWSTHLELGPERDQRVVTLPLLAALAPPSVVPLPRSAAPSSALTPSAPSPVDRSYWTAPHVVGWAALGAGAVAGVGALYFVASAKAAQTDVQDTLAAEEAAPPSARAPWDSVGHAREQDGRHAQALAQGFGVASGVLLVGGAALLFLGPSNRAKEAPNVSLSLSPGAGQLNYAASF